MTDNQAGHAPKVSVISTAYNQQAYVREAYDSFVAQQTEFPVEVIVTDDASTDATPAIIREYADRYPHLFRPIFRSENLGFNQNIVGAMSVARGEYIALCDGDDYWTDPLKLSKQVAFLDRNPQVAVCFHPARLIWEDGREDSEYPPVGWRSDLSVDALIRRNFIQLNAVVYRRLPGYDDIPPDLMPLDWYLHMRHAVRGDIAMLPETMSVYRKHSQGMWYGGDIDRAKFWLEQASGHAGMYEAMLDLFPDDPLREEAIARCVDAIMGMISKSPGPQGRTVLLDIIAEHPRIALLALQRHWATPGRRLKTLWRDVAAVTPRPRAFVDVSAARLQRLMRHARSPLECGDRRAVELAPDAPKA